MLTNSEADEMWNGWVMGMLSILKTYSSLRCSTRGARSVYSPLQHARMAKAKLLAEALLGTRLIWKTVGEAVTTGTMASETRQRAARREFACILKEESDCGAQILCSEIGM